MPRPRRPVRIAGPNVARRLKDRAELKALWGTVPYEELIERFRWLRKARVKRYTRKHSRG